MEEQNKKIDDLEKTTNKLVKQIADQDAIIKDLQSKLVENECKDLKRLQKQIDDLVETNMKKEKAIKKLEEDFERLKEINFGNSSKENEEELEVEDTELDEASEASDIKTKENLETKENNSDEETDKAVECDYVYSDYLRLKLLEKLRNLKVELSKLRRNSTQQIKSKVKELNEWMKKEAGNVWIEYGLKCTMETFNDLENKTTDKDEVMTVIEECIYEYDY